MNNRLPQYWAVKKDSDNPDFNKIIAYMNEIDPQSRFPWTGKSGYEYYGYDGNSSNNGTDITSYMANFRNNPTLLTIAEFVELTEDFVLPTQWYINWTDQNMVDVLAKHFNVHWGYIPGAKNLMNGEYVFSDEKTSSDYTEITFEQFTKYVLTPDLLAFDRNDWNIEVTTAEQRNEVAEWIDANGTDRTKAVGNAAIPNAHFIFFKTHRWYTSSGRKYSTEFPQNKSITWAQFQSLKSNTIMPPESCTTSASTDQTISKVALGEIWDVACDNWKTKLQEKAREFPFLTYVSYTNKEVIEIFEACNARQLVVVSKFFTKVVEDRNAFIQKFDVSTTEEISLQLFGDDEAFQILENEAHSKELKGRGFYIPSNYKVATGETFAGGTWISIYKK